MEPDPPPRATTTAMTEVTTTPIKVRPPPNRPDKPPPLDNADPLPGPEPDVAAGHAAVMMLGGGGEVEALRLQLHVSRCCIAIGYAAL